MKISRYLDWLRIAPQYCLPQHTLSRLIYKLARCQWPFLKDTLIKLFINQYKVDLTESEITTPEDFESFNEFFTRKLNPAARPITDRLIACPVDGYISQIGTINNTSLIQAKGHQYTLEELLADDSEMSATFTNGSFATLYLSPRDYHRIHMPVDGILIKTIYVPGKLFSVNNVTTQYVDKLFARNERVINLFETSAGPMLLIMVGAIFVSSIYTEWAGRITPDKDNSIKTWDYSDKTKEQIKYKKGEEVGRFNMGSTVILLFANNQIN